MPLLEAQLTDVADSLAYSNHDIDDGLRSHFISLDELRGVRLWKEVEMAVISAHPPMGPKTLIARMVSRLIDVQVTDLIEATFARLREQGVDSVEKVRRHPGRLVDFSPELAGRKREMDEFLNDRLYNHYRTLKMAEKAKRFITDIFGEYARNPKQLPPAFQERIPREGKARAICDYVAGMTDRYCQDEYKRMFHPFERV